MAHLVELISAFPHLVCFPLSTKCSCSQLHSSSREMRMWAETSQHRILGGICMPGSVCEGTGCAKLAGHRGQTADGTVVRCCTRKCQIAAAFECCLTLCMLILSLSLSRSGVFWFNRSNAVFAHQWKTLGVSNVRCKVFDKEGNGRYSVVYEFTIPLVVVLLYWLIVWINDAFVTPWKTVQGNISW